MFIRNNRLLVNDYLSSWICTSSGMSAIFKLTINFMINTTCSIARKIHTLNIIERVKECISVYCNIIYKNLISVVILIKKEAEKNIKAKFDITVRAEMICSNHKNEV